MQGDAVWEDDVEEALIGDSRSQHSGAEPVGRSLRVPQPFGRSSPSRDLANGPEWRSLLRGPAGLLVLSAVALAVTSWTTGRSPWKWTPWVEGEHGIIGKAGALTALTETWVAQPGRQCLTGIAAEPLQGVASPVWGSANLALCKATCESHTHCEGVVVSHGHAWGPCWLKQRVDLARCTPIVAFDLHLIRSRLGQESLTALETTPATPPATLAAPAADCGDLEDHFSGAWGASASARCGVWWTQEGWGADQSCGRCLDPDEPFPWKACPLTCCSHCGTTQPPPADGSWRTSTTTVLTTLMVTSTEGIKTTASMPAVASTVTSTTGTTTLASMPAAASTVTSTTGTTTPTSMPATASTVTSTTGTTTATSTTSTVTSTTWTTTSTAVALPTSHKQECLAYKDTWSKPWGGSPSSRCGTWWSNSDWGAGEVCMMCWHSEDHFGQDNCAGTCCRHCGASEKTQIRLVPPPSAGHDSRELCLVATVKSSREKGVRLAPCDGRTWEHNSRGLLRGPQGQCLDALLPGKAGSGLSLTDCSLLDWGQQWRYDEQARVLRNRHGLCLETSSGAAAKGGEVFVGRCRPDGPHDWRMKALPEVGDGSKIVNRGSELCLDARRDAAEESVVLMRRCKAAQDPHQQWSYDGATGHIGNEGGSCLFVGQPGGDGERVRMVGCQAGLWIQEWAYSSMGGQIKHRHGLCLSYRDDEALVMRPCDTEDRRQQWVVREGTWSEAAALSPSKWPEPSIFCFMYLAHFGLEADLVRLQLEKRTGPFACEEHQVFARGNPYSLGEGDFGEEWTTPISFPPDEGKADLSFQRIWAAVHEAGLFGNHDWVVKTDPDAVFLVDRLRPVLRGHGGSEMLSVRHERCWTDSYALFRAAEGRRTAEPGPVGRIEVLTRTAFEALSQRGDTCLEKLPPEQFNWSEDSFLHHCLAMLKVGHVDDLGMLSNACGSETPCSNTSKAVYHPRHGKEEYKACLWKMHAASA